MSAATKIQWCDSTCNPTMGCDGCELWNPAAGVRRCYAGTLHARFGGSTRGYSPSFDQLTLWPGRTAAAAGWADLTGTARPGKPWLDGLPRLIFVSDMSDALSTDVPLAFLETEVVTVAASPAGRRHHWLWLTKRPERMARLSADLLARGVGWPDNLWAGTSVTTQATAARIAPLLRVGGERTVRFLSVEPQHGPLDLSPWLPGLDWVIQGGESGRGATPFHMEWADDLRRQCQAAGVAYFLKQLGAAVFSGGERLRLADGHGGDWGEWPAAVRVREMPAGHQPRAAPSPLPVPGPSVGRRAPLKVVEVESKGRRAALKAWETRRRNERAAGASEAAEEAWEGRSVSS